MPLKKVCDLGVVIDGELNMELMPGTSSAVTSTSSGGCVPFGDHCQSTPDAP